MSPVPECRLPYLTRRWLACTKHARSVARDLSSDSIWVGFADGNVALSGPKGVLCSHVVCSKQAISCAPCLCADCPT